MKLFCSCSLSLKMLQNYVMQINVLQDMIHLAPLALSISSDHPYYKVIGRNKFSANGVTGIREVML